MTHIMLDTQGSEGVVSVDPNDRKIVLMHQTEFWCITELSLENWPIEIHASMALAIVSGLYDVVVVRPEEIAYAGKWPTHVVGPPKQNLGVRMIGSGWAAPDDARILVKWQLLGKEERARFLELRG